MRDLLCKLEGVGGHLLRAVGSGLRIRYEVARCVRHNDVYRGRGFGRGDFGISLGICFGVFKLAAVLLVLFLLVKVVNAVLLANLLALIDHFTLLDKREEACKQQQHSRRYAGEYYYVIVYIVAEQYYRVNQKRDCAAYSAAQIYYGVALRAQRLGGDVRHKRDCGGTEGCHCDKHKQQNHHIYAYACAARLFGDVLVNLVAFVVIHSALYILGVICVSFLYNLIGFARGCGILEAYFNLLPVYYVIIRFAAEHIEHRFFGGEIFVVLKAYEKRFHFRVGSVFAEIHLYVALVAVVLVAAVPPLG